MNENVFSAYIMHLYENVLVSYSIVSNEHTQWKNFKKVYTQTGARTESLDQLDQCYNIAQLFCPEKWSIIVMLSVLNEFIKHVETQNKTSSQQHTDRIIRSGVYNIPQEWLE